jgi:hypothetical protein
MIIALSDIGASFRAPTLPIALKSWRTDLRMSPMVSMRSRGARRLDQLRADKPEDRSPEFSFDRLVDEEEQLRQHAKSALKVSRIKCARTIPHRVASLSRPFLASILNQVCRYTQGCTVAILILSSKNDGQNQSGSGIRIV